MISRFIIRLAVMALAVVCLCAGLLPSSHVEAATACTTEARSGFDFDEAPQTDGKYIVGGTSRFYNGQIYLHDIANNTQRKLSNDTDRDDNDPQIDGNQVVWRGTKNNRSDIYLYNLQTNATINLSNDSTRTEYYPQIDGNYVVWASYSDIEQITEIYLHDLNSGVTRKISSIGRSYIHPMPLIDGNFVVWIEYETYDFNKFYVFDISTNMLSLFNEGYASNTTHDLQMDGERIVWLEDSDTGSRDIFLYDLRTRTKSNLSNSTIDENEPRIDGNKVGWFSWDWLNNIQSLTIYELVSNVSETIALSAQFHGNLHLDGDYLVWQGYEDGPDGGTDKIYFYNGQQIVGVNQNIRLSSPEIFLIGNKVIWGAQYLSPINITTCEEGEPPVITDQPDDVTMGSSGNVTLSVTASGKGPLTYQWYERYNGINDPIDGATSSTYSTNNTGLFGVRVTSPFGSVDSEAAIIWPPVPAQPISLFPNCPVKLISRDMGDEHQTDGEYVVWIDGLWQVNLYDIATGVTLQLSDGEYEAAGEPMVDDGHVVWSNRRYSDTTIDPESGYLSLDIFLYDIETGVKTNLSNSDTIYESRPQIDGKNIVWSGISSSDTAIYHYDLTTGTTTKHLAIAGPNKDVLQIEGNNVLFYSGDYNSFDIYLYNLETHILITLSDEVGVDPSYPLPQINQGYVVWHTSYSSRIYLYDIANAVRTQLSANGRNPAIEGHRVAWLENIGDYGQIHQYDLTTKVSSFLSETSGDVDYYNPISLNDRWTMWSVWDSALRLYDGNTLHSIGAANYRGREIKAAGNVLIWKGYPPEGLFERYGYIFMSKCEGAAPTITDQPDSLTINPNETATLSVTATGDGSLGYQWYVGNAGDTSTPIVGATSSSYTTPALNATTRYWVRVNGTFGSVDSAVAEITMGSAPPATATSVPPTVTPIPATATATDIPATATSIPSTATDVPATETPISPTVTSVPATETSIAPTATTVPATQTPLPPTNVPATATSVPPTATLVPPTATDVPPTATTAPTVSLLVNGGFEIDSDGDKLPDGWTGKKTDVNKADKLKCDKADKVVAHSAPCAFAFSGNPDSSPSALSHQVSDLSALTHGATLMLSAWVDPKSAPAGTKFAQVKISYSDGSNTKLKLSLPEGDGYIQQTDSATLDLTGRTVNSVKVDLKYDQPNGKFYVDDVMLTVKDGTALFALP